MATRVRNFGINVSNVLATVPLNDTGSTSLTFLTTTDNQRAVIEYTAKCAGPVAKHIAVFAIGADRLPKELAVEQSPYSVTSGQWTTGLVVN